MFLLSYKGFLFKNKTLLLFKSRTFLRFEVVASNLLSGSQTGTAMVASFSLGPLAKQFKESDYEQEL